MYAKSSGLISPNEFIWWSDDAWATDNKLSTAVTTSGVNAGNIAYVTSGTTIQFACSNGTGPITSGAGTAISMAVGSGYPTGPGSCGVLPYGGQAYQVFSSVTLYFTANSGFQGAC